jgi:hypothetical protein
MALIVGLVRVMLRLSIGVAFASILAGHSGNIAVAKLL